MSGWNCYTSLDGASWWHHGLMSNSATKQVFPKKKNIPLVFIQQPNILNGCQRSETIFFKGIYVRSAIITDASLNHPSVLMCLIINLCLGCLSAWQICVLANREKKLFCTIFIKTINEPMQKYQKMLVSSLVLWLKVRFTLTLLCVGEFSLSVSAMWNISQNLQLCTIISGCKPDFTPWRHRLSGFLAWVCPWWHVV